MLFFSDVFNILSIIIHTIYILIIYFYRNPMSEKYIE